ncbi:unnamed protein product [Rotaria magnacalcarata]|uniref:Uncharacterized protein n=1 Tax=Rotaria magnacalcarata TaxID=392030 RepID=A0A816MX10_9BILA|nr:unnamed protein product [Rotaria magnacalcarata]CAF1631009.1 unnamed protein product [Rotaria magnacalcarata]CAF2028969.1 unnamed protein product [Rotaria magnacalcarata]
MQISDPDYFYSKYNLNSDARKEQIFDDFNDTSTSTRSISSISSTTSNGYRNPSQWQFFLSFLVLSNIIILWNNEFIKTKKSFL